MDLIGTLTSTAPALGSVDDPDTYGERRSLRPRRRELPAARSTVTAVAWGLGRGPSSAGLARRLTRRQLGAWRIDEDCCETAALLVTELVTNALRYGAGSIGISWTTTGSSVRCGVTDESPRPPRPRQAAPGAENGRGLQLIAALARDWGHYLTPRGKTVWFELQITAQPG